MSKGPTAEEVGARVRAVTAALFGPRDQVRISLLEKEFDPVRRDLALLETCRRSTLQVILEQVTADHTLVLMVMGRLAHTKTHRAILWKCLDAVNVLLMNPTFSGHQDVFQRIACTMDNPCGMVLRCLECFRQRS